MEATLICIDAGTTNTRVWLTHGDQILAQREAHVGVRDTAREGHPTKLITALRELIALVREEAEAQNEPTPQAIIAAGMITSSLGLLEVPHLEAPAGLAQLVPAMPWRSFPDVSDLPFLLVPGIRSGPCTSQLQLVSQADLMRGEETLCLGLLETRALATSSNLLNLGSHWKLIEINTNGQIARSHTTLSGELVHATQTQTILASAVPSERPEQFDLTWVEAAVEEQRKSGLARALFAIRMMELSHEGTPEQRLAYLAGCYLGADLDSFRKQGVVKPGESIAIVGHAALATAWSHCLRSAGIQSTLVTSQQVESGLLTGLRTLAASKLAQTR